MDETKTDPANQPTNQPNSSAKQQVTDLIKKATNVLVTVSNNPSIDQLAGCIGLALLLNKLKKHATAVFSGQVPSTLEFLQPEKTIESSTDSLRDFIISLDRDKADHLRYKVEDNVVRIYITPYRTSISQSDLEFGQGDFNVDVVIALGVDQREHLDAAISAHGRILHDADIIGISCGSVATDAGTVNWNDPAASSLCEMLVSISESFGSGLLDNQMATSFLTGIVAETDRFRNEKTTPKVMTMSAQLMAAGANQQLIASELEAKEDIPEAAPASLQPEEPPHNDVYEPPATAETHEEPHHLVVQPLTETDNADVAPPAAADAAEPAAHPEEVSQQPEAPAASPDLANVASELAASIAAEPTAAPAAETSVLSPTLETEEPAPFSVELPSAPSAATEPSSSSETPADTAEAKPAEVYQPPADTPAPVPAEDSAPEIKIDPNGGLDLKQPMDEHSDAPQTPEAPSVKSSMKVIQPISLPSREHNLLNTPAMEHPEQPAGTPDLSEFGLMPEPTIAVPGADIPMMSHEKEPADSSAPAAPETPPAPSDAMPLPDEEKLSADQARQGVDQVLNSPGYQPPAPSPIDALNAAPIALDQPLSVQPSPPVADNPPPPSPPPLGPFAPPANPAAPSNPPTATPTDAPSPGNPFNLPPVA